MRTIDGMHAGDLRLSEDAVVTRSAMIDGALLVGDGLSVTIEGMVSGDLVVGSGARVDLRGMVAGRIRNEGGTVEGAGMVGQEASR